MKNLVYSIFFFLFFTSCSGSKFSGIKYDCVKLKSIPKYPKKMLIQKGDSIREMMRLAKIERDKMKKQGVIIDIKYPKPILFEKNCNSTNNLNELYAFIGSIINYSAINVRIHGNSDSVEHQIKPNLSLERAQFIKDVMLKNGIEKSRIEIVEEKDTQPLGPNNLFIKENRRVYIELFAK